MNTRGLNAPNKQKDSKLLCNEEQVGLTCLLETKIKKAKIDQVVQKIFGGWQYITNLESHYNGRILIIWRQDYYKVIPVQITAQMVTCEVQFIPQQMTFMLSVIYAFNTKEERRKEERRSLWENIMEQCKVCTKPWMLVGDFNSVLNEDDRIGGNLVTWAEIVDFHNCVDTCGLIAMPHLGNHYTWNDKYADQRIFSKIDWVFINGDWLEDMPPCKVRYLPEGISDHCPAKVLLIAEKARVKGHSNTAMFGLNIHSF